MNRLDWQVRSKRSGLRGVQLGCLLDGAGFGTAEGDVAVLGAGVLLVVWM